MILSTFFFFYQQSDILAHFDMMLFMLVFHWNEIKQESPDQVPLQVRCPAASEPLQSADSITGGSPLASRRNFGLRVLLLTGYFPLSGTCSLQNARAGRAPTFQQIRQFVK